MITLAGPPGAGKSSLAALLATTFSRVAWVTAEQDARRAAASIVRITREDRPPPIYVIGGDADLWRVLADLDPDVLVVLDSLTRIAGWSAQVDILERADRWVREGNRRLLAIQQVNARGAGAGSTEIPHLVGATTYVDADNGLRIFGVTKNRSGGIGQRYFQLGADGISVPSFPYAYSVEGEAGGYRLHPYPLPGARWAGLMDVAAGGARCQPPPGCACASLPVASYPGGVLSPADVAERQAFAEAHGLRWLATVEDAIPSHDHEED